MLMLVEINHTKVIQNIVGNKFHQGNYEVQNPEKYVGNIKKVRYLSSWELVIFKFFDNNKNILKWGAETVVIKYYSNADQKHRRYMVDLFVEYKNTNGEIKKELIEVKPLAQTIPPISKRGKKKTTYLKEVYTYQVNIDKWQAASIFAKARGMTFRIVTEKDIFK